MATTYMWETHNKGKLWKDIKHKYEVKEEWKWSIIKILKTFLKCSEVLPHIIFSCQRNTNASIGVILFFLFYVLT